MTRILTAVEHYPDKTGKTGRDNAIRLRAFVLVLRYTGMRIGDVTSLSVDRVSEDRIFLYTAKTGTPVSCVLPRFVSEALKSLPRLSEKYYFWTGNSTLHTAIGIWQRSRRSLFKLAKVSAGFGHRFRGTFSVELLLAGVPMEEVSILLGHSSIKITQQHYSPWVRDRQLQLEGDLERAWLEIQLSRRMERWRPGYANKVSAQLTRTRLKMGWLRGGSAVWNELASR
jgi:integrase